MRSEKSASAWVEIKIGLAVSLLRCPDARKVGRGSRLPF
jgi:hypothetical protein